MLATRGSQLPTGYLHEGMLFSYFPLTDTEVETGKDSKYNILCGGMGDPHGITLRSCREHAEIIPLMDPKHFVTPSQWPRLPLWSAWVDCLHK